MGAAESRDCVGQWMEQVAAAQAQGRHLLLRGAGTKSFLAQQADGEVLDVGGHRGVVDYQPSELVLTVRSGTRVAEVNALLAEQGQYFPCEPPEFSGQATVGGMVASGWAGPRRPWSGSIRDYVLGCRLISGQGKHMRFGGQVMKNVAGYDVSRLMAGSFGCLGILTEVSLKVLPQPRSRVTRALDLGRRPAVDAFLRWRREGLPLSGLFHDGERMYVRLEGGRAAVAAAARTVGGEPEDDGVWQALREHALPFFQQPGRLWRLSLPVGTVLQGLREPALMDWAGAQWWVKLSAGGDAGALRTLAAQAGGRADCYDKAPVQDRWQLPEAGVLGLNRKLKAQLDPHGLFNRGWLFPER